MAWLEEHFAFFGCYHHNKWNKVIHFFFVPSILWTVLVWLCYAGPLLPTPTIGFAPSFQSLIVLNPAFLLVVAYSIYFTCIEFFLGSTWTLFMGMPMWIGATAFQSQVPNAAWWALAVNVFSWYMQIHPGHAILEHRSTALRDGLTQAFILTPPLFVWADFVFLLGYRPQLQARIEALVEERIAKMDAERDPKQALLADQRAGPSVGDDK